MSPDDGQQPGGQLDSVPDAGVLLGVAPPGAFSAPWIGAWSEENDNAVLNA
ncbi:hypothetical protein ACH41H_49625 [Streptomyces sp. NPDC020800]|uniref:hypothetical protein n=1 Tax=Streptomyces sp. NPDC020800 TaxID=3365092 RepID=UPI003794EF96